MDAKESALVKETTACRACGSWELLDMIDFGEVPLANGYLTVDELDKPVFKAPLTVKICRQCLCVQLAHTVDPEVLFKGYRYLTGGSGSLAAHYEEYASDVVSRLVIKPGLDLIAGIGGNDGTLELAFKKMGFEAVNIEPADVPAMTSEARGVKTFQRWFGKRTARDIVNAFGQFSLLTCNNCFAHMPDLDDVMAGVKTMLKPDGWLVIESADLEATLDKALFDQFYHEHCFYWHEAAMDMLTRKHGLSLWKWDKNDQQGGGFRAWIRNSPASWKRVYDERLLASFEKRFLSLVLNIARWRNAVEERLLKIPAEATIACYGWPAKATLLAHLLGLDNERIRYAVDDMPSKRGLFTPAGKIPIVGRNRFIADPPDYCLLTAANYAKEIVYKNPQFQGQWIRLLDY